MKNKIFKDITIGASNRNARTTMKHYRLLMAKIEEYLDSSWRGKTWPHWVYRFRWTLLGLSILVRGMIYPPMLRFLPAWVVHDPLHRSLVYCNVNAPIYVTILFGVTFVTTVHYILSSTFDQPLEFWINIDKAIYRLEKFYLSNLPDQPFEKMQQFRRCIQDYWHQASMRKTSQLYNLAHPDMRNYFNVPPSFYHKLLGKINQIEVIFMLVYVFSSKFLFLFLFYLNYFILF